MKTVTIARDKLLSRVSENYESHRNLFLEAQKGYRKAVIQELDKMLKSAKDGNPIITNVALVEPQDHTDDYLMIIDMLEMTTESEIELTSREFENYVRDNWDWSNFAAITNTSYTS